MCVSDAAAAGADPGYVVSPCPYEDVLGLTRELDLAEPVAAVLVRRGFRTPEAARAFLAADERHPAVAFEGIEAAAGEIRGAVAGGEPITVYGDYDVDGTTATAILVGALREMGARCDWMIPGRLEDGYGLTPQAIERLAERGTRLIVTVDCGITSVAEVGLAKARGMRVVVTDHHQPAEELPACPIVHPAVSAYPCEHLCAAGVAHKLVEHLLGPEAAERDLDLVALATVADVVPLVGENRALVRRGIEAMRRSPRPGLAALMDAASVGPERIDEGDLSFRLSPRINAAGRLYRADAAVELFLCESSARAREIAGELNRANMDRREVEAAVLVEAGRAIAELPAAGRGEPALVVWGEGWHPGVVGICASRLAERHGKPAILIALDESGRGKGSGRSVPGFDLLAGLRACEPLLERFGGHRAAAGLEIEAGNLEALRQAFCDHARDALAAEPVVRPERIDAIVGGADLGHEVAAQIGRLGPFGQGNPEVRLLCPSARITDVKPMGEEGRHARFSLVSGGSRAGAVAFGMASSLNQADAAEPRDVSLRLELNHWNGAVSPRAVVASVHEPRRPSGAERWAASDESFEERLASELELDVGALLPAAELGVARERSSRGGASPVAAIASLVSMGEPVLVLCADALWRRGLIDAAGPAAPSGASAIVASRGCTVSGDLAAAEVAERGGLALADWTAICRLPGLARGFKHVVVADPAPHPGIEALAASAPDSGARLHVLATATGTALAERAVESMLPGRADLAAAFRALRVAEGPVARSRLRGALCGSDGSSRSPEAGAWILRVLLEIGVLRSVQGGAAGPFEAVSSVAGDLGSSESWRALRKVHEECTRFLSEHKTQSSSPHRAAA